MWQFPSVPNSFFPPSLNCGIWLCQDGQISLTIWEGRDFRREERKLSSLVKLVGFGAFPVEANGQVWQCSVMSNHRGRSLALASWIASTLSTEIEYFYCIIKVESILLQESFCYQVWYFLFLVMNCEPVKTYCCFTKNEHGQPKRLSLDQPNIIELVQIVANL